MNHLRVRPRTAWARPLFVALIVLSLAATASVAVAASAAVPTTSSLPLSAAISTLNATSAPATSTVIPAPPTTRPALRVAPVTPQIVRPQVVVKAATVAQPSGPKAVVKPAAKPGAKPAATPGAKPATATAVTPHYVGVYHLWIPALGLSRGISDWGCRGGLIPDRVEYWGCVGKNNLYLLGHAGGVFAKIHDGHHSGALRVGLTAYYADKAGDTHRYRISQIRHVTNASYATWSRWAMAASSGPVITLQTCDGPTNAYRILVRLVPA